jgi:transcriptional regulator GlxA family with amidase domain
LAVCLIDPGMPAHLPCAPDRLIEILGGLTSHSLAAQWPHVWAQLGLSARPAVVDERVAKVARELERRADQNIPAQALADAVGLSASRLEHLFVEHKGAPMRSYRTWLRFRSAALAMATGATLTEAAHMAGFYDHAHFGRAFRQAFGVTPSFVLGPDIQFCAVGQG